MGYAIVTGGGQLVGNIGQGQTELYALGTRLSGTVVAAGSGILVLLLLRPEQIGVFLAFSGLAALSSILDLGLNYSFLLAVSSHSEDEATKVITPALVVLLPSVIATSFVLLLGGAAILWNLGIPIDLWLLPWVSQCVLAGVFQILQLTIYFVEGTGRRDVAWRANFWFEVAGGAVFLSMIASRLELWAPSAGLLTRISLVYLMFGWLFRLPQRDDGHSFRQFLRVWRTELWPMQWRTLVNNLNGLLTTRLVPPMLFAAQGAAAAGRLGVALSLTNSIVGITAAWPMSQTALYAALFNQRRLVELARVFRSTCVRSTILAVGVSLVVGYTCHILREGSPHIDYRLPDQVVIWLIIGSACVGHLTVCFAIFIRAKRTDPVVFANLSLSLVSLVIYAIAAQVSARAFAASYLITAVCFATLYASYLYTHSGDDILRGN